MQPSQGTPASTPPPPPRADDATSTSGSSGSQYTRDTDALIDDLLDNYQFHFNPEIRVKFKRRHAFLCQA